MAHQQKTAPGKLPITNNKTSLRDFLQPVLMSGGLGLVLLSLGADLITSNSDKGFGTQQTWLLLIGLLTIATSITLDATIGRRQAWQWITGVLQDKIAIAKFLSITVQLGLLVLITRLFHLENQAFYHNIMLLTFFGFIVHHWLPTSYRLPFFLLLSLAGISGVMGITNSAWLIGIGVILIGICHLPIPYLFRVAALFLFGGGLALLRAEIVTSPLPTAIWPILGSMFIFRLIVYMYDLKHLKGNVSVVQSLSYFFLLPNVVFPLFPVVDYSTFRKNYFDEDQFQIYQRGIIWIRRGVIHLLLYRVINYYLVISPEEITGLADLLRYIVTNFLLYLRVSGQFHIIVGILLLFGFNLPRTNNLYCLSSSFTDFWRRINIYWKDFMQKVFFYPVYFKLRKMGPTVALVLATAFVFLATWFLHAYQWFWLRGTFLISKPDILFWSILAILVIFNSLYETRYGRKRTLGKQTWSVRRISVLSLQVLATFTTICVLWSLWSSPSITDWLTLWSLANLTSRDVLSFLGTVVILGGVFAGAITGTSKTPGGAKPNPPQHDKPRFFRTAALSTFSLILLFSIGHPAVYTNFAEKVQDVIEDLSWNRLSRHDAEMLQRGYYEDLIGVNRFNSQLWELYIKRPDDWPKIWDTGAARKTNDFLKFELVPSMRMMFRGKIFQTNRWGMRDKEYEKLPSPGTCRIAMLGSSHVSGWGVANNENFESRLEQRLNTEHTPGKYSKYEILNFGTGSYTPLQMLLVLEEKALSFHPNALFYIAHPAEDLRSNRFLVNQYLAGVEIPYDFLTEELKKAGIFDTPKEKVTPLMLRPYGDEIIRWVYQRIISICQQNDMLPVWVVIPSIPGMDQSKSSDHFAELAREAGFIVINLAHIYDGLHIKSYIVAEWDYHPNKKGHALIANRLYQAMRQDPRLSTVFFDNGNANGTSLNQQ